MTGDSTMNDANKSGPDGADPSKADPNKPEQAPMQAQTEMPDQAAPDPLVLLEAEKAELKDKLLRVLAEMENLRRRTERELADARAYAVTGFARDILNVVDNLARALDAVPTAARAEGEATLKGLIEGVELTSRDLFKSLERHGVKSIEAEGQRFDPNLHQAMFEVPDPQKPNGTIVTVVQGGFTIGERVLRPALVGVSKGAAKAAPATEAAKPVDKPA
jgi:molecular chaperone GrpE